jgi:HEAT repeat protein
VHFRLANFEYIPAGIQNLSGNIQDGEGKMEQTFKKLTDKSQKERWNYVIYLEKFGQPAVEYLHSALEDEDKWVRYMAADALGNIGDVRSIERLVRLLRDKDQDVRFASAYALGNIGHISASQALAETCNKDNGYVRVAAEEALAKLNTPNRMKSTN